MSTRAWIKTLTALAQVAGASLKEGRQSSNPVRKGENECRTPEAESLTLNRGRADSLLNKKGACVCACVCGWVINCPG